MLREKSRHALYDGLMEMMGDEDVVNDVMQSFPATDGELPVSGDFLRAEMVTLRSDLRDAWRSDLTAAMATVDARFDAMDAKFDARFDTMDAKFDARFDTMDAKFNARFNAMDAKFNIRFDTMDAKFNARFNAMDAKFNARFGAMDTQFDARLGALARDLRSGRRWMVSTFIALVALLLTALGLLIAP